MIQLKVNDWKLVTDFFLFSKLPMQRVRTWVEWDLLTKLTKEVMRSRKDLTAF